MKSSEVSFMPPLKPLVRGVRMARVMTTSSAFFWVLLTFGGQHMQPGSGRGKAAYIADSPLLLGVRWLRMELSLSVAMIYRCDKRGAIEREIE